MENTVEREFGQTPGPVTPLRVTWVHTTGIPLSLLVRWYDNPRLTGAIFLIQEIFSECRHGPSSRNY